MDRHESGLDAVMQIVNIANGVEKADRLTVIEMAWLTVGQAIRAEALAFPGGFPVERASQLEHLEKMAAIVRIDEPDLELERLYSEGNLKAVSEHLQRRMKEADDTGHDEKGGA